MSTAKKSATPTGKVTPKSPAAKKSVVGLKKKDAKAADDKKEEGPKKSEIEAEVFKKLYAEQREAERVKSLESEVDTLKRKVQELTTLGEHNSGDIRKLIIHYDSKLNERDSLLTRAQQTIQELTETVTKQRMDAARLSVQRDNELARRINEEQMETKIWKDKFNQLFNDEKNKRMENLERDKKRLEIELEKAVKNHALHATELEHKIHLEKTKIRYSMIRKIKETKNSLLAKTKDQLHTTTKRVIMENEQMTTELQYQSKETERTIEANDKLRAENRALRRDVELAAQESTMLANRTFFLKKLIDKLTQKLKIAEKNNGGAAAAAKAAAEAEAAAAADHGGLDAKDQHIHELETQLEQLQSELESTRAHAATAVDSTRQASAQLLSLQDEGTAFILSCLDDLKRELPPNGGGAAAAGKPDSKSDDLKKPGADEPLSLFTLPTDTAHSSAADRRQILELLLDKLRTTAAAATQAADQLPTDDAAAAAAGFAPGDDDTATADEKHSEPLPAPTTTATRAAAATGGSRGSVSTAASSGVRRDGPTLAASKASNVIVSAADGLGMSI